MTTNQTGECYSILLKVERKISLNVGRLGPFSFPQGYYVYTGRAKGRVVARIQRHMRKEKRLRWHIDYLTSVPGVKLIKAIIHKSKAERECEINKMICKLSGAKILISGFGSSDCQSGCESHLVYFREKPLLKKYTI